MHVSQRDSSSRGLLLSKKQLWRKLSNRNMINMPQQHYVHQNESRFLISNLIECDLSIQQVPEPDSGYLKDENSVLRQLNAIRRVDSRQLLSKRTTHSS